MVKVKIIRHSERLDHANPFYWLICFGQYWADSPLSRNGYQMAETKGRAMYASGFDPKHIYASPYSRTIATATIIKTFFHSAELVISAPLAEYQPRFKHHTNLHPNGLDCSFEFPETFSKMQSRARVSINEIIQKHDGDVLIVTHGAIVKAYVEYVNDMLGLNIETDKIEYLTALSFDYDKETNTISDPVLEHY